LFTRDLLGAAHRYGELALHDGKARAVRTYPRPPVGGRNHGANSRWTPGISTKTINGTTAAVITSVRSARGQPCIVGPTNHKTNVMLG
jgi:hypothetical protein